MKKFVFFFCTTCTILLAGCFENIQEITLNEDGSGTISNTSDMSTLVGLVKQMGGADMEKMADEAVDTTIALASRADSIANLTAGEKELVKKGTARLNMNLKDEKFITTLNFPFASPADIAAYNRGSGKVMAETMKEQMGGDSPIGDMPEPTSFDDYFNIDYSNGLLLKKLNKEKYDSAAANDEYLKAMKESGSMGLTMSSTLVINLPRPATKVEGKNVKVSDDKKKIIVKADIDDFFDDPAKMEFRIEY